MAFSFVKKDDQYLPIQQQDQSEVLDEKTPESCKKSRFSTLNRSLWISWIIVLCLVLSNLYTWARLRNTKTHDTVFSPASSVIRYKNVVGTAGLESLHDTSPYQGPPSEANNQLWEDLYQFGITRIPMSEAAQLANRTVPISDDPGYYAVTLDVFHQLHCLNIIRQTVWPTGSMDFNPIHVDHCIDTIRQSLMCSSDITPIPYIWFTQHQENLPVTNVLRTCRDFDVLREWARERQSFTFNTSVHVDDPLGNVVIEPIDN